MDRTKRFLYFEKVIKFLLGNIEISIININYEPPVSGRYFNSHCHSTYELHYIPSGFGKLKVNSKNYDIEPGIVYLTGPGIFHEQISDIENPMIEYGLNFEFKILKKVPDKYYYYNKAEVEQLLSVLKTTNFWFGRDEHDIKTPFEEIYRELDQKLLGYYGVIQGLASQIIFYTARNFVSARKANYDIPNKLTYDKRRVLIDGFFRNYDRPLKAENLAKLIGVSIRQLDRILKSIYGKSFKQLLNFNRMEICKELLTESDMLIKDIALKLGYPSISFFYKTFSKYYGMTPLQYKSSLKGN